MYLKSLFLLGFMVSCGDGLDFFTNANEGKSGKYSYRSNDEDMPDVYHLADPHCNHSNSVPNLGRQRIWLQEKSGSLPVHKVVDLSMFSGSGLKSKYIHETYGAGKDLFFCRTTNDAPYPRKSLEHVALTAAHWIHKTAAHFEVVAKESFEKIVLDVHRQIKEKHREDEIYIKDNAYWGKRSPFSFIAVIPHSKKYEEKKKADKFWEVAAVFAHEYGHHIFAHLAPRSYSLGGKEKTLERAVDGINEGFADLVSFAATDLKMEIAGKNRDIGTCHHCDDTRKTLTREFIDRYFTLQTTNFTPEEIDDIRKNKRPVPNDCHALGAILAHGFYHLFNGVSTGKDVKKDIVTFARKLNTYSSHDHEGKSYLNKAIEIAVETASRRRDEFGKETLNSKQCADVERVFPEFSNNHTKFLEEKGCRSL